MNVALWILQGLVALLFGFAGSAKLFLPIDQLAKRFPWMAKVSPLFVRFLGVCELAGAVGLIAPEATAILPTLTPVAALGLSALMTCAIVFHVVRREMTSTVRAVVILLLVVAITIGRRALLYA